MKKALIFSLLLQACHTNNNSKKPAFIDGGYNGGPYKWATYNGDTVLMERGWTEEEYRKMRAAMYVLLYKQDSNSNIVARHTTADSIGYYESIDPNSTYHVMNDIMMDFWYHKPGKLYPTSWGVYKGMKKSYYVSPYNKNSIVLNYYKDGDTLCFVSLRDSIGVYDMKMDWPNDLPYDSAIIGRLKY